MKQLISRFSSFARLINQRRGPVPCYSLASQPPSYINRHLESIHQLPSCHALTNDLFAIKAISRRFDRILPPKYQQQQQQQLYI